MTDELIGKSLGPFEIIEEIGRGGMATVYRARQTSIKRIVAVKVLPRSLLHDPSFYERFAREVDLVAHLEHPHILPIYDYGEVDGTPYIAMRYLAGGSMAQWLRRGLPPLDQLSKPMTQVAAALDYAHQQGVIHRDLKPGNVLMDENGNAYLSDFGIARVLNSNLTGSAIIGTPAYMSPEQANGLPLDARSDIYSLGVMLFELITGRSPFEAETPVALLLKHINEPIPSLRDLRPELPLEAERVVIKATAKHPDGRYPSAGDLAQAFSNALRAPATHPSFDDDPSQATLFDPESLLKRTPPPINLPKTALPPAATRQGDASSVESTSSGAVPSTSAGATGIAAARRGISPALIVALLAVIALVVAGIVVLPRLNPPPATPVVAAIPTPFEGSYAVRRSQYSISVPNDWTFTDLSGELGMVHLWQLDQQAYIALWLVDKANLPDVTPATEFSVVVDSFDTQVLRGQDALHFIDSEIAPDGSIRRSYQFSGMEGSDFPPGQTDNFYLDRGDYVVLVQMYSSYGTENTLVPTFQSVLDSVRVTQA
ncbi:MAG: serine/threonine-protein kinase [Chloroflexota bacterium]